MDLFEDDVIGDNSPEFSVSEISRAIKRVMEGEFGHVRVRGEIGRVSRPASGHLYFDLKEDRAVLNAVTWKGVAAGMAHQPQEGMEVVATGRLTTFAGQSRYQLVVESIAPAGVGALMAMLEKRKKMLAAEGLFAEERKRKLPYLPKVIGVITSPSGAVIRDILHRLRDRFPRPVYVWPVPVQGEKCAPAVAEAIAGFNALEPEGPVARPDVLIVARGGGSLEDLWGFNEEIVARAAAASAIPLISAVGHETDTTLIDYVADRRAPTPSAAAEMAVPVRLDLVAGVADLEARTQRAMARFWEARRQRLRDLARGLPRGATLLAERAQMLDDLGHRLPRGLIGLARDSRLSLVEGAAGRFGPSLLMQGLERRRLRFTGLTARLRPDTLERQIESYAQGVAQHTGRIGRGVIAQITDRRAMLRAASARLDASGEKLGQGQRMRLDGLSRTLQSLGPSSVLERGYAIVRGEDGALITRVANAATQRRLRLTFADGDTGVVPDTSID